MMKTKTTIGLIAAIFILLALSVSLIGYTVNDSEDTIKIGWMGPLTGSAAVLGMDSITAAEIAVDEINANGGINGKQIELIVEDDQYNTQKSLDSYNKLVNVDGVDYIIFNTYGAVFALADRAERDNVLLLDPLDCNTELANLGDNIFCLATDSENIADVLTKEANKRSENIGIFYYKSDIFMPLIKDYSLAKYNGEISLVEGFPVGTKDFKTSLTKALDDEIDSLFLLGYDEMGIAMKQARSLGFPGQFYMPGTVTSPSLQEAAEGNAEGTILAFWEVSDSIESREFGEEFINRKGRPPILDLATYPSYDAIKVLEIALRNGESVEEVKSGLLEIQGFSGVTGEVSFDSSGASRIEESAYVLEEGRPVRL